MSNSIDEINRIAAHASRMKNRAKKRSRLSKFKLWFERI